RKPFSFHFYVFLLRMCWNHYILANILCIILYFYFFSFSKFYYALAMANPSCNSYQYRSIIGFTYIKCFLYKILAFLAISWLYHSNFSMVCVYSIILLIL